MVSTRTADLLSIVQSGLKPRAINSKKIIVVGAGMAGLVAGYELKRAGHDVKILEARERVGGRILTLREPFSNGLYAEAGAMRLPSTHKLVHTYAQKLGVQTTGFTRANPNSFFYINGRKHLRSEVEHDPASLGLDFAGPKGDRTVVQLWGDLIHQTAERLEADAGYWDELRNRYGDYSFYNFLRSQQWSTDAISAFALIEGLETILDTAILHVLQLELQWLGADMTRIVGGMDRLPMAFLPELEDHIQFGAEMVALDYTADSVTIHYRNHAAGPNLVAGDFAIVTLPYSVLRFVDVLKPFSPGKQIAVRQLHYIDATKVFLQCRRRFWEEDDGLFGGATITDLPIRQIHYPDHNRETKQGVLMGSYTYGEEAKRWTSRSPEDRVAQTLKYVAMIHPQVTREYEKGVSKVWSEDEFSGGAFAVFEPGEEARLSAYLATPEGPIHFAGEHTSYKKRQWIEGAVESGLRTAQEVHERSLRQTQDRR
jgi:monoamine oxidase